MCKKNMNVPVIVSLPNQVILTLNTPDEMRQLLLSIGEDNAE